MNTSRARKSPSDKAAAWKAKLRESCLMRMNHHRSQLLWELRSPKSQEQVIKEIMSKELENIRIGGEDGDGDMLWNYSSAGSKSPSELSPQEYEDLMLAMQAVLYQGTYPEQQQHAIDDLEDYEKATALEDSSLASLFEQNHQENGVLCPLCRRGFLLDKENSIRCSSNGCLDLESQRDKLKVGVEFVRIRLAELMDQHYSSGCSSQPVFTFKDEFQSLFILCNSCDFFEVVV
ncbi:hypothetical protein SELMODRAFT_427470 [Selaginella moellendorffii]|uniref:RPA-interacting protein C-terminal domain-containing protein n=1 Tax=Selaginella moellendorffii TaxID=88036 RepID=D8SZQ7_SELML|nr:hypothetical protein SELMODRAFT_427470 [Selaginella moellendorffii]